MHLSRRLAWMTLALPLAVLPGCAASFQPASYVVAPSPDGVMPFLPGMTAPVRLSGPTLYYSAKAREDRVQGLMIVKCVITMEGKVTNCRVIKSLPHMENAIVEYFSQSRFTPATLEGKPLAVYYDFMVTIRPNRYR